MKAAVLHQVGEPKLELRDDLATIEPGPNDVKVRIRATGVCHSDLSATNGTLPIMLPAVLGHEGAGDVVAVGSAVGDIKAGDRVIVCWMPSCGSCKFCIGGQPNMCIVYAVNAFVHPNFLMGQTPVFSMAGTGTFAEEVVLPRPGVVKVGSDVPYDVASLIGCGVMTGVGAAINTAQVRPGSSVLVVGCGGVGISVIQGARLAGAAEIVAVDMVDKKLDWARQFGATRAVTPDALPQMVQEVTGGDGFDYGFEVVGRSQTIRSVFDATRRGGTTIVVGAGAADDMVSFSAFELFVQEKTIKGSMYGSADVRRDFPRLVALWRAGRLDLDAMITRRIGLEDINDAFAAMQSGEVIRQVIEFA
jgi:S-(hydroxymethyl)glutathione dehydrogenase / alcohol dehydrogenase